MAAEAGVILRYHTFATGVVMGGKHIAAVIVESKSGREAFAGKIVVDATGDADIAVFAGVPFETGRAKDGAVQPMRLTPRYGSWERVRRRARQPGLPRRRLFEITAIHEAWMSKRCRANSSSDAPHIKQRRAHY